MVKEVLYLIVIGEPSNIKSDPVRRSCLLSCVASTSRRVLIWLPIPNALTPFSPLPREGHHDERRDFPPTGC